MTYNDYPRETAEFVPITVTIDGATTTTGVETCVTPSNKRPGTTEYPWVAAATDAGKIGFLLDQLAAGSYKAWARVGTVVVDVGLFVVS